MKTMARSRPEPLRAGLREYCSEALGEIMEINDKWVISHCPQEGTHTVTMTLQIVIVEAEVEGKRVSSRLLQLLQIIEPNFIEL